MKAFDSDILRGILAGNPAYAKRIAAVLVDEQAAPIVAGEEIIRRSYATPKLCHGLLTVAATLARSGDPCQNGGML